MHKTRIDLFKPFVLIISALVDDGPAIQTALFERTGQSTVPSVFISALTFSFHGEMSFDSDLLLDKEHIGGSDELAAAERSGKLRKILAAAAKHT